MEEIKVKLKDGKIIFDVNEKTYFIDSDALLAVLVNKEMHDKIRRLIAKLNVP